MSKLTIAFCADYDHLLIDIELTIPLEGITGLFGHSGSGKTSLLKAVAGLTRDFTGKISCGNHVLFDSQIKLAEPPEQRQIVGVFQQDGLFPHLTVRQNLTFAIKRRKTNKLNLNSIIEHTEITHLLDQKVTMLSGGERQKVAIARALLAEPKLLLLDEPVTALDRVNKANILRMILTIQQALEVPILYVSHNLEELQALADNLIVISEGKVINQGTTDSVIHELNHSQLIEKQTSLTVSAVNSNNNFGLVELFYAQDASIYAQAQTFSAHPNKSSRCYILASDVSICKNIPGQSSIVNQVKGVITDIEINQHQVLVTADVNGLSFYASISSYSLEKLALTLGNTVYLQFKASAIRQVIY